MSQSIRCNDKHETGWDDRAGRPRTDKCERRKHHTHGHFATDKKTGIVRWWYPTFVRQFVEVSR